MKIEIKNLDGEVIYSHECEGNTVRKTVEAAVREGADLRRADLRWADLPRANLSGANLYGADLYGANLSGADLRRADLRRADLRLADLYGANLSWADLRWDNIYGANLSGAVVLGDTIQKAPISVANLRWSVLITEHKMQIGCQTHTHEEWASFDDDTIVKMDGKDALRFWRQWKAPLLAMCAAHKEQQ